MNCRECQEQLADLSADALVANQDQAMREHFAQCAHCYQEWSVFERTLTCVSSLDQPLPSPLASEQMWHRCSEHIFNKVEAERVNAGRVDDKRAGASRQEYASERFDQRGWFARQPRWSWATLAGAFAVLGAVWFLSPPETTTLVQSGDPGELIALRQPPAATAGLVNNHSAMSIDPFTDYVGTTLISNSATSTRTISSRAISSRTISPRTISPAVSTTSRRR